MAGMVAAMPNGEAADAARVYAVGDVHGRLDLLRAAVDMIDAHVGRRRFRLIFLGDYVDRGPDSRGVVECLIDLQARWPVVCLKGNHEALMVQAITSPGAGRLGRWLDNGGDETLRSYGLDPAVLDPESGFAQAIPRKHIRWLAGLANTTGDGHRIFVHAGLLPGTPIDRQKESTLLWIRERFLEAPASGFDAHVVHGHTPLWAGKPDPAEPELLDHRTNIDTAAFATGVLTVAVFDPAKPGGPIEVLKVRGQAMGRLIAEEPDANEPASMRRRGLAGWFGRRGGAPAPR
jgi:serine/threonine protein phosphatase 1